MFILTIKRFLVFFVVMGMIFSCINLSVYAEDEMTGNNNNILNSFVAGDIRQIAAGKSHNLLLLNDGTVYAWGENQSTIGDGTYIDRYTPVMVNFPDLTEGETIVSIAAGYQHSAAVTSNGDIFTWGYNFYGQLGEDASGKKTPTRITIDGEIVTSIVVGDNHNMAITDDGDLYTWGSNNHGQLGDGTTVNKTTPLKITIAGETIVTVAAGAEHSMVVTSDGDLYTWGRNDYGQLGVGSAVDKATPTKVTIAGETISSIAADFHSMAVTSDGDLYTWGKNDYGQLGNGLTSNKATPTKITITGEVISSVAAGITHSMAVTDDGELYTWGRNNDGQLGSLESTGSTVPLKISVEGKSVAKVAAGDRYSFGVTIDGNLYAWGYNKYGQLACGIGITSILPIKRIISGETILSVAAGESHSIALTSSGNVYTWGYNEYGQLGDGTKFDKGTPTLINFPNLSDGETIVSITAGFFHSMAVTNNGYLYTWGRNDCGQLGDGTIIDKVSPNKLNINGKTIVTAIAGYNHSMAITIDGDLYTWGFNGSGQLGDGTQINKTTPQKINIEGKSIASADAGQGHSIAVTNDGSLYTWGYNGYGQIGDGTTSNNKAVPTKITIAGEIISSVAAGTFHSMAITSDGELYTWGRNIGAQLGDGTTIDRQTPRKINIEGKIIKSVAGGTSHSMATTIYGELYTWGCNHLGQLGDGTKTNKNIPTKIDIQGENIISVAAGTHFMAMNSDGSQSMALTSNGDLYIWGFNKRGQLGDGFIYSSYLPLKVKVPKRLKLETDINFDLTLTASNISKPYRYIYYICYDTNKFSVNDICAFTSDLDQLIGYIPGTSIIVLDNDTTAGIISLTFNDESNSYTGILNKILFNTLGNKGKISVVNYVIQ